MSSLPLRPKPILEFTASEISRIVEMAWEDRTPFEAIELRQEVFIEETEHQTISYGKSLTYIRRNNSKFAQYFKPTELSEEDRIYLEKFKRFVGLQKLN